MSMMGGASSGSLMLEPRQTINKKLEVDNHLTHKFVEEDLGKVASEWDDVDWETLDMEAEVEVDADWGESQASEWELQKEAKGKWEVEISSDMWDSTFWNSEEMLGQEEEKSSIWPWDNNKGESRVDVGKRASAILEADRSQLSHVYPSKMKYPDNGVYIGTMKNGMREGNGRHDYPNGDWYLGEWVADEREGEGKCYSGGNEYLGAWQRGRPEGQGCLTFQHGDTLQGNFKSGHAHGECVLKLHSGEQFIGNFHNGNKHGVGIMVLLDGQKNEESWDHGTLIKRRPII
eukprot:CAMPEP_0196572702 /NCGR_PEP_ID=MMETSP1081-20130531/2701_1 /TAXON_ID=36882 /ORGANISM="Pyramimonas amylifera, Strain CCMP720" /LENGTH=288 /DNA_ID=CAMNT_0041890105 /DNA_START=102 /DNA_END=968 /DNA_ORIENTATION=+